MKLLNEILKTALIFLLVTLMWFVNIDVSKDDSLPRMIVGIILTNPPIKVIATIGLLISLFDIWYDPPNEENN